MGLISVKPKINKREGLEPAARVAAAI